MLGRWRAGALGGALALGLLAGCGPARDWREMPVGDSGLVARFPCRPHRVEGEAPVAGQRLHATVTSCEAGDVTYGISTAEVPDATRVEAVLAAMATAAAAAVGASSPGGRPLALPGMTPYQGAVRLRLTGRRPDGRTVTQAVSIFARGGRVFQATAVGESLAAADVDPFEEGLRFDVPR